MGICQNVEIAVDKSLDDEHDLTMGGKETYSFFMVVARFFKF